MDPRLHPDIAPGECRTVLHRVRLAGTAGAASLDERTPPFDRKAVAEALREVSFVACRSPSGPTGDGHVTLTFAPDGHVDRAIVDGGPFPGTPVGGCIGEAFRGVTVPPFGGAPVRVGKSFRML
jgi:serine/threonine-protein kinase